MPKKKKTEKCIDCGEKSSNFYVSSINSGKIIRCSNCHELNIIRSVKYDTKYLDSQQVNDLQKEL
jgi:DNA-directed RNA polymerase subunit RPC12/RpoP